MGTSIKKPNKQLEELSNEELLQETLNRCINHFNNEDINKHNKLMFDFHQSRDLLQQRMINLGQVVKTSIASLSTYGIHPIIESNAIEVLNKFDTKIKKLPNTESEVNPNQ